MAKVILVFASMTGNTEDMADAVAEGVQAAGAELTQKNVMDTNASELAGYDGIILGAYTWGDGDLPDEFLDFYDELEEVDLAGKKAAVFGSCDSSYSAYGAAVDTLIEKLQERGAEIVTEGLKVELGPSSEDKEVCKSLGETLARSLQVTA
ncbi:flavodoxin [Paenibacillus mucilaginosus]|uniref:Flavodoxin n=2 Tax=Paenibacillus mucilaginosus TaxID=61624 RepID=H6NEL9_9BACL|nr:flavodoxin [Paenibacillus mucilaginosus]AEI39638.1 Flavodoxin [Paenibacillus mucilaginosus KNP414]AFC28323.1 Flavodoxin [Paenibacillus mucilaginosus 3016]MCG7217733.1 flavodoxin [Paenibacillus mucilaginosus]WDM28950.1 flavodoxin [Paenibacillus mucilaginosus]WFA17126.1 flavodoxin [Paenibacillus mucilaginosus]